jgi:hypothetical protein
MHTRIAYIARYAFLLIAVGSLCACQRGEPPNLVPSVQYTQGPPLAEPTLNSGTEEITAPTPIPPPSASVNPSDSRSAVAHYLLEVQLSDETWTADVVETIEVTNNSTDPWNQLAFHLPFAHTAGVFDLQTITGEDAADTVVPHSFDPATLILLIQLAQPLQPGVKTTLNISYSLNVPLTSYEDWPPEGTVGHDLQIMQLGNWYPVLVPYRSGEGWYTWEFTEVGDPYVTEVADYDLEIRASESMVVASGGERQASQPSVWRYHLEGARTVGFSASPAYLEQCQQTSSIQVCSYFLPEHQQAGVDVLQAAVQSLELFSEVYGPYPYPSLVIAEDAFFGSMEYTGFVLHSGASYARYDGRADTMLIALTAHEVSHQWWYSLVGSDQVYEPWLDEALAMYSELAFYRRYYPELEDWYWSDRVYIYNPTGSLTRSIYDFPDSQTYNHQLYRRGLLFVDELRARMGDERFYSFLQALRQRGQMRLLTTDEFFDTLEQYGEYDAIIAEYFPERFPAVSTSVPNGEETTYVVEAGDTLLDIAIEFGVTVDAIMRANQLPDENTIYVGQRLVIPAP